MFKRLLKKQLLKRFFKGKILIITGARQTGKTTLVSEIQKEFEASGVVLFNCDNITDREKLKNRDLEFLQQLIGNAKLIIIDEAQKVENIGDTLKLLVDHYKQKKQIIVTGSSSINLLNNTQEPLTGRKYVYNLFTLSLSEIYDENYLKMLNPKMSDYLKNLIELKGQQDELQKEKASNQKELNLNFRESEIISQPVLSSSPFKPNIKLNILVAFIIGLSLSVFWVFLKESY